MGLRVGRAVAVYLALPRTDAAPVRPRKRLSLLQTASAEIARGRPRRARTQFTPSNTAVPDLTGRAGLADLPGVAFARRAVSLAEQAGQLPAQAPLLPDAASSRVASATDALAPYADMVVGPLTPFRPRVTQTLALGRPRLARQLELVLRDANEANPSVASPCRRRHGTRLQQIGTTSPAETRHTVPQAFNNAHVVAFSRHVAWSPVCNTSDSVGRNTARRRGKIGGKRRDSSVCWELNFFSNLNFFRIVWSRLSEKTVKLP